MSSLLLALGGFLGHHIFLLHARTIVFCLFTDTRAIDVCIVTALALSVMTVLSKV